MTEKPIFIAEIKTQSPFGFKSPHTFAKLMDYACHYGDWVSVHTNALWGGDYDAISFVRKNTNKPILAKGIHGSDDDIKRALDHGADYVLVVGRIPDQFSIPLSKCLLEIPPDAAQFINVRLVCNSRDLATGRQQVKWIMDDYLKVTSWVCQASNIRCPLDVHQKASAFIVGEHLIDFIDYPTHH